MDGKMANPVTKKIMLGYIHISNDISYKPIEGIFLNAKFVKIKTVMETGIESLSSKLNYFLATRFSLIKALLSI